MFDEPLLPPASDNASDYASSLRRDVSTPPRQISTPRSASWTAPGRLAAQEASIHAASSEASLTGGMARQSHGGDDGISLTCSLRLVALTAALGSFASGYACASIGGAMLFMEKDHTGFWPDSASNSTAPAPAPGAAEFWLSDPMSSFALDASSSSPSNVQNNHSNHSSHSSVCTSSSALPSQFYQQQLPGHFSSYSSSPTSGEIPTYFTSFRRGLLVSCILASGMIGALLASSFADLVGRRAAQLLNNAFFVGGSLAMAIAPSYWWLVYARTAVGLGVGVSSALTNLYISEISPAAYRGQLGGWAPFSVTAGILSSYILSCVLGEYVPVFLAWRLILGIGAVPAVFMLFIGAFERCLPESPRWLLTKGRPVRAFRSSMLLHGKDQKENIQRDLDGILLKMTLRKAGDRAFDHLESHGSSYNSERRLQSSNVGEHRSEFASVSESNGSAATRVLSSNASASTNDVTRDARTPSERLESELVAGLGSDDVSGCDCCCRLCSRRKYRGAMLAGIGINVLQQVSGINVVIYFGPQILKEAGFGSVQATALTAGVSTAQLISVAVLMRLVDRVGRRPMAFIGLAFMIVGLSTIGVAFLVLCEDSSGSVIGAWAAVAGMLIYRIAFSLSLGPLPYIVTAEVFPNEVRACGVTVAWAANWVANFGVTLSFPLVKHVFADLTGGNEALGSACLFGVYVVFSALAVCFVAKYVPETARRELDEL